MRLLSIKTYARRAYINRYAFERVTIDDNGVMLGHWAQRAGRPALDPVKLGHIGDCCTAVNGHKTGIVFRNRGEVIYTFAMPA